MSRTNQEKPSEPIPYCPGSPEDPYAAEGAPLDEWESWKAIQRAANSVGNAAARAFCIQALARLDPDALPRRASEPGTGI